MTNEELARKAVTNVAKVMLVKWGIVFGLNALWRRHLKKAAKS